MFQFRVGFWPEKIKWKYFGILHIDISLLWYLHVSIHLLPFIRKKSWQFWNKFPDKRKDIVNWHRSTSFSDVWVHPSLSSRFKFHLRASSMFSSFLEIQNHRILWNWTGFFKYLECRLCGLLPFVRKGQMWEDIGFRLLAYVILTLQRILFRWKFTQFSLHSVMHCKSIY